VLCCVNESQLKERRLHFYDYRMPSMESGNSLLI
jgi:hypothetical protein